MDINQFVWAKNGINKNLGHTSTKISAGNYLALLPTFLILISPAIHIIYNMML